MTTTRRLLVYTRVKMRLVQLAVAGALLASPAWTAAQPAPSPAGEVADLDARYERGRERFAAGDIQGALDDYRAVYAARPTAEVAGNLGNAAYQLGLWAESAEALRWGLANLPADDPRRPKFQQRYDQARSKAGALQVAVEPSGATVLVDGLVVELGPKPTYVMPGPRRLEARLDGYQPQTQTVDAAPGVTTTVTMTLAPAGTGAPAPLPTPLPMPVDEGDDHRTTQLALGITGLIVGAGGIGAGIGLLLAASAKGDDAAVLREQIQSGQGAELGESPCGEGPVSVNDCPALADAVDGEATFRAGGIGALVAGVVVAGLSATYLFWPSGEGGNEGTALQLDVAPGYAEVRGTF